MSPQIFICYCRKALDISMVRPYIPRTDEPRSKSSGASIAAVLAMFAAVGSYDRF